MPYYIDEDDGQIEHRPDMMRPNDGDPPPPSNEGDITITGYMRDAPSLYQILVWGNAAVEYNASFIRQPGFVYENYANTVEYPANDEDGHTVDINIGRSLSDREKAAHDKFVGDIARADKIINSLPDNTIIKVPGHRDIIAAQFKQLWSKTDFTINDIGTKYDNSSSRGQAAFNNRNPQVSLNIDIMQ